MYDSVREVMKEKYHPQLDPMFTDLGVTFDRSSKVVGGCGEAQRGWGRWVGAGE